MIIGSMNIAPTGAERSWCRISEDYYMVNIADYRIHSTTLMAMIPFERAREWRKKIDRGIFVNCEVHEECRLRFPPQTYVQNYLTTRYVGRAPLEHYGPMTRTGRKFILRCPQGESVYRYRYFGTEGAMINNPTANTMLEHPRALPQNYHRDVTVEHNPQHHAQNNYDLNLQGTRRE